MRASPDKALTESTNDAAPAKMDLQAVLLMTLYSCLAYLGGVNMKLMNAQNARGIPALQQGITYADKGA